MILSTFEHYFHFKRHHRQYIKMDPMYRYQVLRFYGMEEFSPDSPVDPTIENPHVREAVKRWYARMAQEIINDRSHMVVAPPTAEANQPQATSMPATTNSIDLMRLYNDSMTPSSSSDARSTSISSTSSTSTAPSSILGDPPAPKAPLITTRLSRKAKMAIPMLSRGGKLPSSIRVAIKEMYGVEVSLEEVLNVLGIAA
jgi:hypothetical protein